VYQDVDDLLEVGKALNPNIKTFDAACFDGHYVTGVHAQLSCQAQTFTDLQPAPPPPPPRRAHAYCLMQVRYSCVA
jgi:hypothetical protein